MAGEIKNRCIADERSVKTTCLKLQVENRILGEEERTISFRIVQLTINGR